MRRGAVAACVALVGLTAFPAPAAAAPVIGRVQADTSQKGRTVPRSFLGYSFEINAISRDLGRGLSANTALAEMFRRLAANGAGPPGIRIGGGSQDEAYYNPDGRQPPHPGVRRAIDVPTIVGLREFLKRAGSRVVFGLNLAVNDPVIPMELAKAVEALIPLGYIRGFELGNEPDIYDARPLYRAPDGTIVMPRKKGYGPAEHIEEFTQHRRAFAQGGVKTRLWGPGIAVANPLWGSALYNFVHSQKRGLGAAAVHLYPLSGCKTDAEGKPTGKRLPDREDLLEDRLQAINGRRIAGATAVARTVKRKLYVTEANSATCGGISGVSDRFAAALWATDWSFTMLLAGASAVYYHASPALYRPFTTGVHEGAWRISPGAELYGQLLFSEAAPAGARLLPSTYFGVRPAKGVNLKAWGTLGRDGTVRVALIHKGGGRSGDVIVRVPRGARFGRLQRLQAPSVASGVEDIRWSGQQLPLISDGRLAGRRRVASVRSSRKREFRFRMQPHSAALLTVKRPRRRR